MLVQGLQYNSLVGYCRAWKD